MRVLLGFLLVATSALLTACGPVVLQPTVYGGTTSVVSSRTTSVELISGVVTGSSSQSMIVVPSAGLYMPVASGPVPELQFNEQDQRVFVDSMRAELARLGLFAGARAAGADAAVDTQIKVLFAQTFHDPEIHAYTLDVAMQIVGGATEFVKRYRIVSNEGDSFWTKMNTNAAQGKKKAADKLMAVLIPDIEAWVKANPVNPPAGVSAPPAETTAPAN